MRSSSTLTFQRGIRVGAICILHVGPPRLAFEWGVDLYVHIVSLHHRQLAKFHKIKFDRLKLITVIVQVISVDNSGWVGVKFPTRTRWTEFSLEKGRTSYGGWHKYNDQRQREGLVWFDKVAISRVLHGFRLFFCCRVALIMIYLGLWYAYFNTKSVRDATPTALRFFPSH